MAVCAIASMPTVCATCSVTRFSDFSSAMRSGVGPPNSISKLFGRQRPAAVSMTIGASRKRWLGEMPFSSAVR